MVEESKPETPQDEQKAPEPAEAQTPDVSDTDSQAHSQDVVPSSSPENDDSSKVADDSSSEEKPSDSPKGADDEQSPGAGDSSNADDAAEQSGGASQEHSSGVEAGTRETGPRKILDALDKQAGHNPDTSKSFHQEAPPAEEPSPDDLPLPPQTETSQEQDKNAATEEPLSAQESDSDILKDSQEKQPLAAGTGAHMDPELMISDAMRRLDQILQEIKQEDSSGASSDQAASDAQKPSQGADEKQSPS